MFLHFLMFLPASWWVFRRKQALFLDVSVVPQVPARLHWARFIVLVVVVEVAFAAYFLNLYGWLR